MEDGKIKILYEDNHIIVVEKKVNMLVQADSTHDLDLLTLTKNYIKEKYQKPGNVYLGLVHRLDRPVGGIIVFAKTSKAAARLSTSIKNHEFKKTYLAIIDGKLEHDGVLKDKILNKDNKVTIDDLGKESKLEYRVLDIKEDKTLVSINLITGRKHQIRIQFASRGFPLWGDLRYNKNAKVGNQLALWATRLEFKHPTKDETMIFKSLPNTQKYPWSLFKEDVDNL